MELLILRHCEAVEAGVEGVTADEDRILSTQGKQDAQNVGRTIAKLRLAPGKAFTSPIARCRETAQIVLNAAGSDAPIEISPTLKPGATPLGIIGLLTSRASGVDRVLIVGHQPDLGKLVGSLAAPQGVQAHLPPGAIARIDVDQPKTAWTGRLVWLLPPDVAAHMG